jgi:glutamyl-tRNA reductase
MLMSLAVDYRFADVSTREYFHFNSERLERLYGRLDRSSAEEVLAIQTCNRSELYAWQDVDTASGVDGALDRLARRWMGSASGARRLLDVSRRRNGQEAVEHLFRVSAGVESQVLGDGQLLSQLREAYRVSSLHGGARSVLRRLAECALHVGKRVRTETSLNSGRHSVGAEAASVVARRFGSLQSSRVVIVGCGKTGERAARQLFKLGARDLVLINRTPERAAMLAASVRGRAARMEELYGEVARADAVIVATASLTPIILAAPLTTSRRESLSDRDALFLVDLSVPRNVDPGCHAVGNVVVVDLDTLRPSVARAERDRQAAVPAAEIIVRQEVEQFMHWLSAAAVREAIRPLRTILADVCYREVAYTSGHAVAAQTVERIVAKVLARPMIELKAALARGEPADALAGTLSRLFLAEGSGAEGRLPATFPTR